MKIYTFFRFLVLFSAFNFNLVAKGFQKDPRDFFYKHAVVQPKLQRLFSAKRHPYSLKNAKEEKLKLEFHAFDKSFTFHLEENKALFSPNYKEMHQEDGKDVIYEPVKEHERCYYQGQMPKVMNSWAAISTCNGISGVVFDGQEAYMIEPNRIDGTKEYFVFKASDQKNQHFRCGVKNDQFPLFENISDYLLTNNLRDPYKSNADSKYIELVVINANSMFQKYGNNIATVLDRSKSLVNIANSLLSKLNVFLALQSVRVWTSNDPIEIVSTHRTTLDNFLKFRKDVLLPQEAHDNALLLAQMDYGSSLGMAYPAAMCKEDYSGESVSDKTDTLLFVGAAIAHEIAHNLGAWHDDDGTKCKCPEEVCIMFPYQFQNFPTHWSSCSSTSIQKYLATDMSNCINNKPTKVDGPSCGNGYLEEGEQCDCGIEEICDDQCCDATTCQRKRSGSCS